MSGEADESDEFLQYSELGVICDAIDKCEEPVLVQNVVAVKDSKNDWGELQPLVHELRAAIHRDYDATVLSGHIDCSERDPLSAVTIVRQ